MWVLPRKAGVKVCCGNKLFTDGSLLNAFKTVTHLPRPKPQVFSLSSKCVIACPISQLVKKTVHSQPVGPHMKLFCVHSHFTVILMPAEPHPTGVGRWFCGKLTPPHNLVVTNIKASLATSTKKQQKRTKQLVRQTAWILELLGNSHSLADCATSEDEA